MRTILVSILAFTAWLQPLHAASALLTDSKTEETVTFINYEQRHVPETKKPDIPKVPKVATKELGSNNSPVQNNIPAYSGRNYSKEEVQQLIRDYSAQYGINSDAPLCIASKESGFDQFSKNKSSTASGVFQYLSGTWKSTDEGKAGYSVFDADANVKAAIKYMASRLNTKPWVVGTSCPPVTKIK